MNRASELILPLTLAALSACAANKTAMEQPRGASELAASVDVRPRVIEKGAFAVTFNAPYTSADPSIYIRITEITGSGKVSFSLTLPSGEQLWLERAALGSEWQLSATERLRLSEVDPPVGTAYFVIVR